MPSKAERAANDPLTKHVNMVVDFAETPERLKYWHFTKPYMVSPLHLIVRQDSKMTSNLSHIGNVKIAVVNYYAARELFASDHPNLELILVNTAQEGLKNDVWRGSRLCQ